MCNALGLPQVSTGAFASVYEMHCGNQSYAVRCFLTDNRDRHERYKKISEFVRNDHLPETVEFTYLEQGICLNTRWYPILKMEWIKGKLLSAYVDEHLEHPEKIKSLAEKFKAMVMALNAEGAAHGDLQHGNIIVCGDELRLVDYDGMFVPALSGQLSYELGHPNYQHPRRTSIHFGNYLDNFSSWLIYITLHSVRQDPNLWKNFNGGDERLLFSKKDMLAPAKSALFSDMLSHSNSEIRAHSEILLDLLEMAPEDVPSLGDAFAGSGKPRFQHYLNRLESNARNAWSAFAKELGGVKNLVFTPFSGSNGRGEPHLEVNRTISESKRNPAVTEKFRQTLPTKKQWSEFSNEDRSEIIAKIDNLLILKTLSESKNPSLIEVAAEIAAHKVTQSAEQARQFISGLILSLKKAPHDQAKLELVLEERLYAAFHGCKNHCVGSMPEWLSGLYFESLDAILLRRSGHSLESSQPRPLNMAHVNVAPILQVWLRMPWANRALLEDFLIERAGNVNFSEEFRVRCIYAARQLLDLYNMRYVTVNQGEEYKQKIRAAKVRLASKRYSFLVGIALDDKWSNI